MEERLEKGAIARAVERSFYFLCQRHCLFNGPLRKESGMDHEKRSFTMMKRLASQPLEEIGSILGGEYVADRVFRPKGCDAFSHCKEKQIMVSQDEPDGSAKIPDESEGGEGIRAAIDQVSNQPDLVAFRSERNPVEKLLERNKAALDVADCVGGHQ